MGAKGSCKFYRSSLVEYSSLPEQLRQAENDSNPWPLQKNQERYLKGDSKRQPKTVKSKLSVHVPDSLNLVSHNSAGPAVAGTTSAGGQTNSDGCNDNNSSVSCFQSQKTLTNTKECEAVDSSLQNQQDSIPKNDREISSILAANPEQASKVAKYQTEKQEQGARNEKQLKTPEAILLVEPEALYKVCDSSLVRIHTPWQSCKNKGCDLNDQQQQEETQSTQQNGQNFNVPTFTGLVKEYSSSSRSDCRCKTGMQCQACRKVRLHR
jgi:hypothetical protein